MSPNARQIRLTAEWLMPVAAAIDLVDQCVWRGRKRRTETRDPKARQRWPVERTNAWLKTRRRVATRRDRPETDQAFIQLAMILILTRSF